MTSCPWRTTFHECTRSPIQTSQLNATHSFGLLLGFQVLYVQCAKASVSLPSKCAVKLATCLSWVLTHLPPDWEYPIHQEKPAAVE
jgi:hypothetical protein